MKRPDIFQDVVGFDIMSRSIETESSRLGIRLRIHYRPNIGLSFLFLNRKNLRSNREENRLNVGDLDRVFIDFFIPRPPPVCG